MPPPSWFPLSRTLERSGAGWATRALEVAASLPAALTSVVYLEQWLGGDRVDLIVRIDREGGNLICRRWSPPWPHVAAAVRAWHSGPLRETVSALWLEFDLDEAGTRPPSPRVFVDFATATVASGDADARLGLVLTALASLCDGSVDPSTAESCRRLHALLPASARVLYVGATQDGSLVRLCVAGLHGASLVEYLERIDWPGDVDRPAALVLAAPTPPVTLLHLDMAGTLLPRAGLECALDRRAQQRGVVRETAFLDRLVECGLCTLASRDRLLSWPAHWFALLPHDVWYSRLVRRVNHVKVVYDAATAVAAKGYLCLSHALAPVQPAAGLGIAI